MGTKITIYFTFTHAASARKVAFLRRPRIQCMGKPLLGRIVKSFRQSLPERLQNAVDEMIACDNPNANNFMPLVRTLTSNNKHKVDLVINDIIIYLEPATVNLIPQFY